MRRNGQGRDRTTAQKIVELRVKGYSYQDIAMELGITAAGATIQFSKQMRLMQKEASETAWEARQLDLERTDLIIKANIDSLATPLIDQETGEAVTDEDGNPVSMPNSRSAETLLKAMNHRAKLLGLYAEEPAPMDTLEHKVNDLLEKDVAAMSDEELDAFFQAHWEAEKENG